MSNEAVELSVLLENARRLQAYTKPLFDSAEIAKKAYKWEDPFVNVGILVAVNFTCFFLPAGLFLVLLLLLVSLMVALGVTYQYHTSRSELGEQSNGDSVGGQNKSYNGSHEDLMHEYVAWLRQMNSVIITTHKAFQFVQRMLLCTYRNDAVRFYFSLTVMSFSFCLLTPIQCVAMLINILLLDHILEKGVVALLEHISKTNRMKCQVQGDSSIEDDYDQIDSSDSTHAEVQRSNGVVLEAMADQATKELVLDSEDKTKEKPQESEVLNGDIAISSDKEEMSTNSVHTNSSSEVTTPELSPSRTTAVVNKIVEFKKKHTNSLGTCTNCGVTFTSFLKRRHVCSKCGHAFCSRCCNHKVAKSVLGVTAPGAKTDMVATCQACYLELTSSKT